ncbi:hypothetical protein [Prosthecobacter sp.]|uniref:hypothetical protein n=1 Tax=Prosthecobacter sp. TaxID=1965333 RepID=UPI002AB9C8D8|nr:hypothetical protein [Prosthecobacter sp.]MDZ4404942.1 hypothetical protein [Prosthecobacter sp.]
MKVQRILLSIAGGILLLALFVAVTWALSINFPAEGADTPIARQVAVTYSWAFFLAHSLNIRGLPPPVLSALILGVLVLAYSGIVFIILTCLGIPRRKQHPTDTSS